MQGGFNLSSVNLTRKRWKQFLTARAGPIYRAPIPAHGRFTHRERSLTCSTYPTGKQFPTKFSEKAMKLRTKLSISIPMLVSQHSCHSGTERGGEMLKNKVLKKRSEDECWETRTGAAVHEEGWWLSLCWRILTRDRLSGSKFRNKELDVSTRSSLLYIYRLQLENMPRRSFPIHILFFLYPMSSSSPDFRSKL